MVGAREGSEEVTDLLGVASCHLSRVVIDNVSFGGPASHSVILYCLLLLFLAVERCEAFVLFAILVLPLCAVSFGHFCSMLFWSRVAGV